MFAYFMSRCDDCMMLQAGSKASDEPSPAAGSWPHSATWQIGTNAGPRFAALNGDINLIHLSPVLARLFGFPSNIAHGVFLVSKSIAAMQQAGVITKQLESLLSALYKTSHESTFTCCRCSTNIPSSCQCFFLTSCCPAGSILLSMAAWHDSANSVFIRLCCTGNCIWKGCYFWEVLLRADSSCQNLVSAGFSMKYTSILEGLL